MRKVVVEGGFYKIRVGRKDCKVYVKDLKMLKKLRKKKCPPIPKYEEWSHCCGRK